jgi:RNA polymerase sigma-70 factor (ECF subfamily)
MQPLPDEKELIERAQRGDREAVSTLYEHYTRSIFQYISYRVEVDVVAEDLTAEVFLRMVRGLPDYVYTGAPMGAWLFRIAANQVADHYRQQAKLSPVQLAETHRSDAIDPLDAVAKEDESARLRQALQALSEDYQNVLVLRFMQDLPYAEVAAVMDRSEAAVRVLQHRALKALDTALSKQQGSHQEDRQGDDD